METGEDTPTPAEGGAEKLEETRPEERGTALDETAAEPMEAPEQPEDGSDEAGDGE